MPVPHDYVTGSEFKRWTDASSSELKRWMDEESAFRARIEQRMIAGFSKIDDAVVRVESQVREANGKTAEHARLIAVIQRDLEAIRSEELDIEKTVHSIKEDGCSQYGEHVRVLEAVAGEPGGPPIRSWVSRLNRPQKVAAAGGIAALLIPAVVDLVRIGYDALVWWQNLHHVVPK